MVPSVLSYFPCSQNSKERTGPSELEGSVSQVPLSRREGTPLHPEFTTSDFRRLPYWLLVLLLIFLGLPRWSEKLITLDCLGSELRDMESSLPPRCYKHTDPAPGSRECGVGPSEASGSAEQQRGCPLTSDPQTDMLHSG